MAEPLLTIAVVASKGGTAKTTLTTLLAVAAAGEWSVALFDWDPQPSLTEWAKRRAKLKGKPLLRSNPLLAEQGNEKAFAVYTDEKRKFDLLLIDSGPADEDLMSAAIREADLVLIPVQPSSFDIKAVLPVAKECKAEGVPFAFVLSRVMSAERADDARKALSKAGPVLKAHLSNRQEYIDAAANGQTGAELSKTAEREVAALWAEVRELAEKAGST